jgi:hypothetical protein
MREWSLSRTKGKAAMQTQFDTSTPTEVKAILADGQVKKISVRFPSDDEWIERQRHRKIVQIQLGRGKAKAILPEGGEADLLLLSKIIGPDTEITDPAEAARILEKLSEAEARETVRVPEGFSVKTEVRGGVVTEHVLSVPSASDMAQFNNLREVISCPNGRTELCVHLNVAGNLYRKLLQRCDGYATGNAPIVHQLTALTAVINAFQAELSDDETEKN